MNTNSAEEPGANTVAAPASARIKRALGNPKRRRRLGYPPMSRAAWDAHMTYLRQGLAKLRDPSAPEPDPALLIIEPRLPFTAVWVAKEPDSDQLAIYFTLRNSERGPRWLPPEAFLVVSLLLAFGGGASINDAGNGWAYLRLWGGNDRFMFGRFVRNPRPGQLVRQDRRADHHDQHPVNFSVTGRVPKPEHLKGEAPRRTREDAIKTALGYFERNLWRAEMQVAAGEYRGVLHDALRLLDAYFAEDVV